MIKDLDIEIQGRGPMKGFTFKQVYKNEVGYIYEITHPEVKRPHFEVFLRKINNRFKCVSYPGGEAFGYWAWTFHKKEDAMAKLEEQANEIGNEKT
jgi:hypothetical protein